MADQRVFDPRVLQNLAQSHRKSLADLGVIEAALNKRFASMEEAIRALILSVASGEPLLFIGPPGTAKSRLIRRFCDHVGIPASDPTRPPPEAYFEYLLTPFTEPAELFGHYDLSVAMAPDLADRKLKRDPSGYLLRARVIYLDEVFNASSAILNSLLAIMQEKRFHDGATWENASWDCLFGATNRPPTSEILQAFYDRFLLRCDIKNVRADEEPGPVAKMMAVGWEETYGSTAIKPYRDLLRNLADFRAAIRNAVTSNQLRVNEGSVFFRHLTCVVNTIVDAGLSEMSNRRLVKMLHVMAVHAMYKAVIENRTQAGIELGPAELKLLQDYGMDRRDPVAEERVELAVRRWSGSI